ncbi:death domain-associated protein 6 [Phycodurus eques]|uniref:death domain-associated protein 6 n=1 Tax=Phycodurus eques TaxID=693459 RepID=UPI002ACEAB2E|nr:death domain-associated protein 6 [Phycodurus eques]XP_061521347.1 death domain-associated protein 6 [Phycodurus eques]
MAVAPGSIADVIVVEDVDTPRPSSSSSQGKAATNSPRRVPVSAPTHVAQSPFTAASKKRHVLQAENQKLFSEFVEHVAAVTQDCPEVLEFLKKNHAKACSDYLSSVEFRNSLGRCLTRVENNRSRMFVYIYELCMVLMQHKDRTKRKKKPSALESASASASALDCLPSTSLKSESQITVQTAVEEQGGKPATEDEKPSTSGLLEDRLKVEKKASRASRKQIAYLENLLKVYDDEICRLQRAELSLNDLDTEDSLYIQEHKLKRKMMKIYKKLCELKDCSSLTGRVLERKILYTDTSYPEISRRIQRYINSPEVCMNPPDYQDILQQVQLASKRHNLRLSSRQQEQIARKAFSDTGSKIQQRRQQDLLYDFGCQLTSEYKPDNDPALKDPSLLRKLHDNRELGLNRLEDVINKYAVQQETTDEKDTTRRHSEEQEEEEDDVSSEEDIEEEIKASSQQDGPDDDGEDGSNEDGGSEAGKMSDGANEEEQTSANEAVTSGLLSDASMSGISPLSDVTSASGPGQSEPTQPRSPSSGGNAAAASEENSPPANLVTCNQSNGTDPPAAANGPSSPLPPETTCHSAISNGTSPPRLSPPERRLSRSHKRKRPDATPKQNHITAGDREVAVLLNMGIICASPPRTPNASDCQLVSSSQSPPPKKNKVHVATQCDPLEIIELSDSE